jgi:hypothetical protein
MPRQPASDLLGIQVTGDLAGITYVQRAGNRRTSYAKTYPTRRPSGAQILFRGRFAAAVAAWQQLDAEHKKTLDKIADRFGMIMSGYNVFISCHLNQRLTWLEEWAAQIGEEW